MNRTNRLAIIAINNLFTIKEEKGLPMRFFKTISFCFCIVLLIGGVGCSHVEQKTKVELKYTIEPKIGDEILLARQYAKWWITAHDLIRKLCPRVNLSDLKTTQPFSGYGLTKLVMRTELDEYMTFVHAGKTTTHTVKVCADAPTTRPTRPINGSKPPCRKFKDKAESVHTPSPLVQLNELLYQEFACIIPPGMYIEEPIVRPAANSNEAKDPNYLKKTVTNLLKKRYTVNNNAKAFQRIMASWLKHYHETTILPEECANPQERNGLKNGLKKVNVAHKSLIQAVIGYMSLNKSAYLQAKAKITEVTIMTDFLPAPQAPPQIKKLNGSGSQIGWYLQLWVSLTSKLGSKNYTKSYGYGREATVSSSHKYNCLGWGQPTTKKLKLLESVIEDFAKLVAEHRKTEME